VGGYIIYYVTFYAASDHLKLQAETEAVRVGSCVRISHSQRDLCEGLTPTEGAGSCVRLTEGTWNNVPFYPGYCCSCIVMLWSHAAAFVVVDMMTFDSQRIGSLKSLHKPAASRRQRSVPAITAKQMRMRITCEDAMFRGMKKVKLAGKELSSLPPSLFTLVDLEVLDLSPEREACLFYHLTSIPKQIARLGNLRFLTLDTNKITELPEELCLLDHLETLIVSNNLLTELPLNIGALDSLRSLHCANNRFTEITPELGKLPNLAFLDYSDNQLTYLPQGK